MPADTSPRRARFAAELTALAGLRDYVGAAAAAAGLAGRALDDLVLAVDEAATNIVEHGYQGRPGFVEVEWTASDADFVVTLRDQAPPFDPTQWPDPDVSLPLEERPIGGLGVYLTRQLVGQVIYRRTDLGDNELTLRQLRQPRQSPLPTKSGETPMNLIVEQAEGRVPVCILRIVGEVDGSNYREVIDRGQALYAEGARALLIDLSAVPFMTSAGLVALHSLALHYRGTESPPPEQGWQAMRPAGQAAARQPHVKLFNPQPRVVTLLNHTGLAEAFEIFMDQAAAVASF